MITINLKSLIEKLNAFCQKTLESAAGFCLSQTHYNIEMEHWLLKLLENPESDVSLIISHYGLNIARLTSDLQENLASLKTGNTRSPALSHYIIDWLRAALLIATLEFQDGKIRSAYLLIALLQQENFRCLAASISTEFNKISCEDIGKNFKALSQNSVENIIVNEKQPEIINSKTTALNKFTVELTQLARQGKIDEVIGREAEIRQVIDILMRRRQNNPILTGEPGVGKTAVVEGLALRIARGEVPENLREVALHVLDLGLLQAGAGIKGEFENRLKSIIQEVKSSSHPIILFIDEAHTLVGANTQNSQSDAANLLKPALARGELRTIAATTWAEYKKYFEQDAALTRRFQVVKVEEPDTETAIKMLRGLVKGLEEHHGVRVLDEAVIAAVQLSRRYIADRQLPDKAISVLDTACARAAVRTHIQPPSLEDYKSRLMHIKTEIDLLTREQLTAPDHKKRLAELKLEEQKLQKKYAELQTRWQSEKQLVEELQLLREKIEISDASKKSSHNEFDKTYKQFQKLIQQLKKIQGETPFLQISVNAQMIAEVISHWTGIPLGRMLRDEMQTVLEIEQHLAKRVIGQSHALTAIAKHIQISRANLTDPRKPIGVFLLVGPSGVGKTETALALAELLYGGEQNLTTINLSEFKEEHKVSMLLGSPPGYVGYGEGGVLTEAVRRKPYSLLLLDEVEKAHPGVQDIFYQVFDKGTIKDGQGRDIDFKNTLIILTSNVASELITKYCAAPTNMPDWQTLTEMLKPELLKIFKPAFLGRVTVVPYMALNTTMLQQIIELQLARIQKRLQENHQAQFTYVPQLISHIAARCQETATGARAIEQLLTRGLLPEISTHFLTAIAEGKTIQHLHVNLNEAGNYVCEIV